MKSPHQAKKSFGQNFLSDEFIIEQIVRLIDPKPEDHLVEIGPGFGAITLPLLPLVAKIDAIELDRDVIPLLKKKSEGKGDLVIHQQDALTFDLNTLSSVDRSLRVVGNLPYNISTPLLFHLFSQKNLILDMHFMLQKEVAERLIARPGTKQYGRLSIMTQYHCEIEALLSVPPIAFRPPPKVDSTFIRLIPIEPTLLANDLCKLELIVKQAFTQRRKTLHNCLKTLVTKEQLMALGIDPNIRPEELSVDNFVKLSNII